MPSTRSRHLGRLSIFVALSVFAAVLVTIFVPTPPSAGALTTPPIAVDGDFCGDDDWQGAYTDYNVSNVSPEQDGLLSLNVFDDINSGAGGQVECVTATSMPTCTAGGNETGVDTSVHIDVLSDTTRPWTTTTVGVPSSADICQTYFGTWWDAVDGDVWMCAATVFVAEGGDNPAHGYIEFLQNPDSLTVGDLTLHIVKHNNEGKWLVEALFWNGTQWVQDDSSLVFANGYIVDATDKMQGAYMSEACVNVTDIGMFNGCQGGFASLSTITSSGTAINGSPNDVSAQSVDVEPCGEIEIQKKTYNGLCTTYTDCPKDFPVTFPYTISPAFPPTVGGQSDGLTGHSPEEEYVCDPVTGACQYVPVAPADWTWYDDDDPAAAGALNYSINGGEGEIWVNVPPRTPYPTAGGYEIIETAPAGTTHEQTVCTYPDGTTTLDVAFVRPMQRVVCVIENSIDPGQLTLIKDLDTTADSTPAAISDFPLTYTDSDGIVATATSGTTYTVAADTNYTLAETNNDADYAAGSWSCVDGTGAAMTVTDTNGVFVGPNSDVTCTITNTFVPKPALELVKTVAAAALSTPPAIDDTITYEFTVTNTGNVAVANVEIVDDLFGAGTVVCNSDGVGALSADAALAAMGAGDSVICTADYQLTQTDLDNGGVENTATAAGTDPTGATTEDISDSGSDTPAGNDGSGPDDPTFLSIPINPSIEVEKGIAGVADTTGDGTIGEGDTVTYSFTVTNTGSVTLTNITLADNLTTISGGPITTLAPTDSDSATFTATYVLTQADVDAGFVDNTATIEGTDPTGATTTDISDSANAADTGSTDGAGNPVVDADGNPVETGPTDDDPTRLVIDAAPELRLNKEGVYFDTNSTGLPDAGDSIEYSFSVTNTGNVTLTNVVITDPLLNPTAPSVVCDQGLEPGLASIAPGETVTCAAAVTYVTTQADIDNTQVENSATVIGSDPAGTAVADTSDDPTNDADVDPNSDGNPDDPTVIQLIPPSPKIKLVKTLTGTTDVNANSVTDAGDTFSYSFAVTNTGTVTLSNVDITDDLFGAGTIICNFDGTGALGADLLLASMAPGATVTCTADYTLTLDDINAGGVENTATATGTDPTGATTDDISDSGSDTPAGNDGTGPDDPTYYPITGIPQLELTKTGQYSDANNNGIIDAGDEILYTFVVTNTGTVTVTDSEITDERLNLVAPHIVCDQTTEPALASMAPGATVTCAAIAYPISQTDMNAGLVENTATVEGSDPDGQPVIDVSDDPTDATTTSNDPTVVPLTPSPALTLVKAVSAVNDTNANTLTDAGDEVVYDFTVTNTGNVTITNVDITDGLFSAGTIICNFDGTGALAADAALASMAPTDSVSCPATYVLTLDDINAGGVENTATATGTDPTGATTDDISDSGSDTPAGNDGTGPDDPTYYLITTAPQLDLRKSIGLISDTNNNGVTDVGDTITYFFSVTNIGTVTITDVTVTDPLLNPSAPHLVCDQNNVPGMSSMTPGAVETCAADYVLTQADVDAGRVENQAGTQGADPAGTIVADDSDDPENDANVDPNNDGEPDDPTVLPIEPAPELLLVKTVAALANNGDGTYDLTYDLTVSNVGTVTVNNLQVVDDLATTFAGSTGFVVATTAVTNGDCTIASTPYDGATATNLLVGTDTHEVGEVCSLRITITVTPGTILGAYENSAVASGNQPNGQPVSDISDAGDETVDSADASGATDGDPTNDPTLVSFDELPEIGVAKQVTAGPVNNGDGSYTITHAVLVENSGDVPLENLQVADDLTVGFAGMNPIVESTSTVSGICSTATTTPFDGVAATGILEGTDRLAVGESCVIEVVIVVSPGPATTATNQVTASGTSPGGTPVTDLSTDGADPDPNGDGPSNDSIPTPVSFTESPAIGAAKRIVAGPDNSVDTEVHVVTYAIDVVNTGDVSLSAVQVDDDLTSTFGGVSFEVVEVALSSGPCTVATTVPYDGVSATGLLEGTDSLPVGESCTIELTVAVTTAGALGPFINQANATGVSPAGSPVEDVSTDGTNVTTGEDPTPFNIVPPGEPDVSTDNPVGNPVTVDPLANDDTGVPLDPTSVQILDPDTGGWVTEIAVPGEGTWTVDPESGEITFAPEDGFVGDPTPIDYRAKEEGGPQYIENTVTITYADEPTPPVRRPLAFSGSSSALIALVAMGLILLGLALVLTGQLGRRRENDDPSIEV